MPSDEPSSEEEGPEPAGSGSSASRAVATVERELKRQASRRWLRRFVWLSLLAGVVFGVSRWRDSKRPPPEPRFELQALEVRDITQQVESTGRLKPLTEVQVGAQVSGKVVQVHADFNSRVKKGELLAEIDPQLFGAQVGQVRGQLRTAQANLARARAREESTKVEAVRLRSLAQEQIATATELNQAESALAVARAEVAASRATITGLKAQLSSARATLEYTKILSPIDGVVISRNVEPGQTVAASFSAPVMFVIAEDLRKMQVLADVDEADVGKVRQGMNAGITVDAFPGERFDGTVTQIRYSPNEVQGVVTYSAVIDVANPELKLRPGMTATATVTTRSMSQVLAAPSAALRFKPKQEEQGPLQPLQPGEVRLFEVSGGAIGQEQLRPLVASAGISDGIWTQVDAQGLSPGLKVVTEQKDASKKKRKFLGLF